MLSTYIHSISREYIQLAITKYYGIHNHKQSQYKSGQTKNFQDSVLQCALLTIASYISVFSAWLCGGVPVST